MDRRQFLRLSRAFAASAVALPSLFGEAMATVLDGPGPYGPLQPPDENGIQLPVGFRSRVIARAAEPVPGTDHLWHFFPDGGDTFAMPDGGWVYVSNSEFFIEGGVGVVRFSASGRIVDAYRICSQSFQNCAGGKTPWDTWLTCEELDNGTVYECDPSGRLESQQRLAMGTFKHEAAAVDPDTGSVYLTEDQDDGAFYRFLPNARGNLSSGQLQVAEVGDAGDVHWHDIPQPNPGRLDTQTRHQVAQVTAFDGGEGIVESFGHIYFTTKGDNRVWDYVPASQQLGILYDGDAQPNLPLHGVDNIAASATGDLLVAEDGGNMELVILTPELEMAPIARVLDQPASELAGPAFDPHGQRLYVSSQRGGPRGLGITYEIRGPFRRSSAQRRRLGPGPRR